MTGAILYLLIIAVNLILASKGQDAAVKAINEAFTWTDFILACGIIGICSRLDDIKKEIGGGQK